MEGYADPEELARLRSVFAAYDTRGSGRLERAEFGALCAELHVAEAEAEAVFLGLDTDRDGAITFPEFARGFRGAFGRDSAEAQGAWDAGEPEIPGPAWRDFHARLGDEAQLIPRKEQVSTLYQNINLVEPRLIQPYEHVIRNFLREIKLQSTEMENLAIAVKRAQDKAAIQLSELEEEMDQRIHAVESETRKDEKRKAEEALSDLRRQYETEVGDLQVTIKKLKKLEEQSRHISQKQDVTALKKQIYDLTMENQKLKKDLLEAQTNVAFLQSELDALKSDYVDQSLNSERDLEIIREYTEDRSSLERQIEILQTANRKLHDSNDGLRSALENTYSKLNRSLKMNYEVDSLSESCFDSGLSTLRDSNECDSEADYKHQRGFQSLHETQESLEGDASDTDVPDIRDEEAFDSESVASVLHWKPQGSVGEGSTVSSSRKPISALSPQADMADNNCKPTSQKAYKIVLAGDAAVGKSSFLMRLCKNEFQGNTSATLGSEVLPSLISEKQTASYCSMMLLVKKAFLTYENGWIWLSVLTGKRGRSDGAQRSVPIMLVGNKADLRDSASAEKQKCISAYLGEKLAMTYGALFCETSAKDGSNVVEAVLHLAREVKKRTEDDDSKSITSLAGSTSRKSLQMKNCCNG
ncbi:hypothetical protein U0070_011866 [Myodes glareolus]|uniref:EF-hand domain-containing protein n=1 Tax=Myodes glareolus TaxID=447135 RepID=A0AAW0K104_MYOGA